MKHQAHPDAQTNLSLTPADRPAEKDPVCGMIVKADSPHRFTFEGTEYRFCCAGCKTKFAADPRRYLAPASPGHHGSAIGAALPATIPPAVTHGAPHAQAVYVCPT